MEIYMYAIYIMMRFILILMNDGIYQTSAATLQIFDIKL